MERLPDCPDCNHNFDWHNEEGCTISYCHCKTPWVGEGEISELADTAAVIKTNMAIKAAYYGLTLDIRTTDDGIEVFEFTKHGTAFKYVSSLEAAFYWLEGYKDGQSTD